MKTAIISPIPQLDLYGNLGDNYHLILSYLATEYSTYRDFYRQKAREGDFIILDNSAHEFGKGQKIEDLVDLAEDLEVSELVLPDRLFFGDDTVDLARESLPIVKKLLPNIQVMGVAQGRTIEEYKTCLINLLTLGVDTIGISKDYEVWPGGILNLVYLVRHLSSTVNIHLLGWGRDLSQLSEIGKVDRQKGLNIRGTDSAKPLVYGVDNILLDINQKFIPKYPRRVENFFETSYHSHQYTSIWNISVFQAYANGYDYIDVETFLKRLGITYKFISTMGSREVALSPQNMYKMPFYSSRVSEDESITVGGWTWRIWRCGE